MSGKPKIWQIVFLSIFITLIIFWKLPFKGLVPFPGDLLVGRFFPFNSQPWEGYPLGVPYKEYISADTIRQTYPWRLLAIEQLKSGRMPWWNPYAFSGTPLLANLQSAPFYPLNLIYWIFDFNLAWIIQVLLQPVLAIIFTYLFLRSLKLSSLSAFVGGVIFAFSGYMTVWLELNTVGQAILWLPLVLYSLTRGLENFQFYWLAVIGITSSIFAGHIQSTTYLIALSASYTIYLHFAHRYKFKNNTQKLTHPLFPVFALTIAILISAIQLIPAYQLLSFSPRVGVNPEIFSRFLLPFKHLITFFIPNFFGNPATNNYWSRDYNEFMVYFGLLPLIFAVTSFYLPKKSATHKFFIGVFWASLLFALATPIAHLPLILKLPVLSSSAPARILVLTQFAGAVLAAFSLNSLPRLKQNLWRVTQTVCILIGAFSVLTLILWRTASDPVWQAQWRVSFRNSAIPLILVFVSLGLVALFRRGKQSQKTFTFLLAVVLIADLSLFANKYLPFSEFRFVFPQNQLFVKTAQVPGFNRFYGDFVAEVTSNIWLPYHLFSTEGYDSLYIKRYGQLLTAIKTKGELVENISRSDANLPANQENFYRQRIQDLLGVKNILYKLDLPPSDWFHDEYRIPKDRYRLVYQQDKYQLYENQRALPRAFLVPQYLLIHNNATLVSTLFDPQLNPQNTVLLEKEPSSVVMASSPLQVATTSAIINHYHSDSVEIAVTTPTPQLLFLSDTFYPGWHAYVDNTETEILRANYAFRAIAVPPGIHQVSFRYQPTLSDLLTFQ